MKTFKKFTAEDAPANAAGTGNIAGLGVGPQGEPGVNLKKKRKTDGDDPLVEAVEFVGRENPKNAIYAKLMKKGKPVGGNMYEFKTIAPEIRRSLSAGFARGAEETDSFYLKPKADVTGVPTDDGYILKDKRPDYIKRFGIKEETEPETFAGARVFEVDSDRAWKSRFGKNRYHKYKNYVGDDEIGEEIRKHGRSTKGDIILKDSTTAVMTYLRRKKV